MCEYSIVDNETGVIVGVLKSGDVIIPAEERKRRCEMRKKREGRYRSKGERYIFVNATFDFLDLPPSIVTKLIYLSTYADYNNSLIASIKSKTTIKRCDLPTILGVSKRTSERFWESVKDKYVREDENGSLWLNDSIFKRGKLKNKTAVEYQQFLSLIHI